MLDHYYAVIMAGGGGTRLVASLAPVPTQANAKLV
jgi:GTP:adenosylcobinamide-phosphate guanylyltransferase